MQIVNFAPYNFTPHSLPEETAGTRYTGGWLGRRLDLNAMKESKRLPPQEIEPQFSALKVFSLVTVLNDISYSEC
jgi:hypothetical protein